MKNIKQLEKQKDLLWDEYSDLCDLVRDIQKEKDFKKEKKKFLGKCFRYYKNNKMLFFYDKIDDLKKFKVLIISYNVDDERDFSVRIDEDFMFSDKFDDFHDVDYFEEIKKEEFVLMYNRCIKITNNVMEYYNDKRRKRN